MTKENHDLKLQRELNHALTGLNFLTHGRAFLAIDSTNDLMMQFEKRGEASGTVVIAARQTMGRGRFKRTWLMKEGDIAMSILLRPPLIPDNWSLLALLPAVAVTDALAVLGITAKLKWPNDIIVPMAPAASLAYCGDFRKVGGILVDNIFLDNALAACVIGIGLNVVANDAMKASVPHGASLSEKDATITRAQCLTAILKSLDRLLGAVDQNNFSTQLLDAYSSRCETLGKDVVVTLQNGEMRGRATRLDPNGALVVTNEQGEHVVLAGEISFARKAG